MKSSLLLKIVIMGLFASISAGCQSAISTSVTNDLTRKSTPTDLESKEYKIEGCAIPSLPEKTKDEPKVEYLKTAEGKRIKITVTYYNPIGESFFTLKQSVLTQHPYNSMLRSKANSAIFSLKNVAEMKVKDKIFGYTFDASEVIEKRTDDSTHGEIFGFTCFDFTGDGNFTYINSQGKLSETVPEWAVK